MPVKAKNYKALTGQGDGQAKNYTLAEMGDLCNDNLLTNSDFKSGIINQKGQTTYDFSSQSNGEFTIDMWKITKMKLIVKSAEGTIRIENSDTTSHSISHKHFDKPLINTHTFYANVKNVSEGCYMWFYNRETGGTYEQSENLVSGDNVWTWSPSQPGDIIQNFGILIPAGGYIELYQCKLEEGSYFTGMPPWNRASELEKCKERFLFVPTVFNGYVDENGKIFIACEDSRKLVKEPSLIIDANTQIVLYYDDGNGTYLLENIKEGRYATKDGYICLGTLTSYKNWRISGYYKSGKIFLNSYEYVGGVQ